MLQVKLYNGGSNWAQWKKESLVTQTDSLDHRTTVYLNSWLHVSERFEGVFDHLISQTRLDPWTWHTWTPEPSVWDSCQQVQHDNDDEDEAGEEDGLTALGNQVSFWFCGPIRLQEEEVKETLTPHWIAAAPAAPLRRLTHVYILKRKNFRIVFSVSNPFLTLASINIWIFKAYTSFSPLPVCLTLNLFSCFLTSVLCFTPFSVPHVCILSWYNLFCCMKY